jgi:hypothetical protein
MLFHCHQQLHLDFDSWRCSITPNPSSLWRHPMLDRLFSNYSRLLRLVRDFGIAAVHRARSRSNGPSCIDGAVRIGVSVSNAGWKQSQGRARRAVHLPSARP